jgi:hypothetical protein
VCATTARIVLRRTMPQAFPDTLSCLVSKSNSSNGWELALSNSGIMVVGITSNTSVVVRNSSTVLTLNSWVHICAVYNSIMPALDIYQNGVLTNVCLIVSLSVGVTCLKCRVL